MAVDPDQAVADFRPLDQLKVDDVAPERVRSILLTIFAVVALALAAVGVYGVLAYSVALRTREMGIRAALGATRSTLLFQVIGRGMAMAAIGLGTGFGVALAVTRMLEGFLFGVKAWDRNAMVSALVVMAAVALVACYVPARRAALTDPLVALRGE
jgi:ABC-type antimicrobial peptide transport system permease subunit